MGLLDVLSTGAVVDPADFARFSIERVNERSHERPNTRGKIDRVIANDRPAASWPCRGKSPVANDLLIARGAAKLPVHIPRFSIDAVQEPVITRKEDLVFSTDRRQSHRCFGIASPQVFARVGVQGDDFTLVIEAHDDVRPFKTIGSKIRSKVIKS